MVRRVYVEKKDGFDMEGQRLKLELSDFLGEKYPELSGLKKLRILKRYDTANLDNPQLKQLVETVFSEPQCDRVFYDAELLLKNNDSYFAIEYLPGQYDQRADSAGQCAELVTGEKPRIKTATAYVFECDGNPLSEATLEGIKKYLINPVDSREASWEAPLSLEDDETIPSDVPVLSGFIYMDGPDEDGSDKSNSGEQRRSKGNSPLEKLAAQFGLAMSIEDLLFCQDWFAQERRDPSLAELKVLDTYWSDHCRHTTFTTILDEIKISGGGGVEKALELYEETRREVYGSNAENRNRSLMDMATIGARALKKRGLLNDLDESPEINACTIKVKAEFSGANSESNSSPDAACNASPTVTSEPWLLLFKNETHNHPTEIEPFGGAATCLGGAIRDPLSGRAFVHQAMRITGAGDPRARLEDTLPGKLPQIKIAHEAAAGYSSYGNQIGLATGQVAEFYHPGFIAKRMELGGVIGAVPEVWVRRQEPLPGDLVILVGGRTGRDGIGGATGSSKLHSGESVESAGAEVQKGNAVEERKLQRLFRKDDVCRLIKRCNDFGAGGVSVAVGELSPGLNINLDTVLKKYAGLDGTELAISESQERMAVVVSAADAEEFIRMAGEENLEAVVIAEVSVETASEDNARLRMTWRGETIVNLSRKFLNTNGASRRASVLIQSSQGAAKNESPKASKGNFAATQPPAEDATQLPAGVVLDNLERELASLRGGSRRGLQERFDGSIGANSVLFPWGGSEQGTPECGMAALLPSLDKESRTASLMTFGYDPVLMSLDPYSGAKGSVLEALAKFACLGGDPFKARLSLQEYFERPMNPETWGKPAAALLGALEAQLRLGVPAIGGKDSMSGNYRDEGRAINLTVPPTLVAFAAGTVAANRVRSGALSGKEGNAVILLSQSPDNASKIESSATVGSTSHAIDEWERFKINMKTLEALATAGAVKAAYSVGAAGVAATLALMAFGNMRGVEAYADSFSRVDPLNYQGSILAEIDESALSNENFASGEIVPMWIVAGRTLAEPVFRIVWPLSSGGLSEGENAESEVESEGMDALAAEALSAETPLAVLRRAYEYPLAQVYPQTSTGATAAEPPGADGIETLELPAFKPATPCADGTHSSTQENTQSCTHQHTHSSTHGAPLVALPVFPGTNCEWDMERAFKKAGAKTRLVVFKNQSREDIISSLGEMVRAFNEAQIIAFSGGFSAGDEPDGSGKFIANVLRSPVIADCVMDFIDKRGGLILGICNGFQALIKTGLVPYGRIVDASDAMPTLTFNAVGRHVSRMVRTRVMPNISPWLSLEQEGAIHVIPVSHGEGRVVVRDEEAKILFGAGQVPFCYANASSKPTMAEPDNPNGSLYAIEGLTSPDGRILGKMAHSERCGEFVHINIPGNKYQRIFEAGVRYFA